MRRKNLDLLLALGIAVVNVIWAYTGQTALTAPGLIITLPLIFAAGYTLCEAIFRPGALDPVQRIAFGLALSLAVTILSGFVLNQFPVGLRALPWALWLGLLIVLFALLAVVRRRKPSFATEVHLPQPQQTAKKPGRARVQISSFILFGMSLLVIVLSIVYSVIGADQQSHPGRTELWILPASAGGNTCAVSVGVQSFELTPVSYNIVITTNKVTTDHWNVVPLTPQQQWTRIVPIPVNNSTSLVVLVQIYRLDHPQVVYRHVDLTLHVMSKTGATPQCTAAFAAPSGHLMASV